MRDTYFRCGSSSVNMKRNAYLAKLKMGERLHYESAPERE
jgi:hypothetical protein